MGFVEFIGEAHKEPPKWWWLVSGVITTVLLIFTIKNTPMWISQKWAWWLLVVATLWFIGVMWGAHRLFEEQRVAYEARIAELEARNQEKLTQELGEAETRQKEKLDEQVLALAKENFGQIKEAGAFHGTMTLTDEWKITVAMALQVKTDDVRESVRRLLAARRMPWQT